MPIPIPKRSPWANQRLVLGALLHREAITRFGKYKLGVFWMLVEPLVPVLVLGFLLGPIVGRTAPDMPYSFFLLNGFVLLQTFVGPMMSGMNAVNANQGLLVFPKVQPLDLLLARFTFELLSSMLSFTVFCLLGVWFGISLSIGNVHVVVAAFIVTWMLGSGLGMILCVGNAYFQSVEKVVAFIKRPLLFVSCILYPLYNLPNIAQKILLFNPLVHTIEMSRKSLFPLYHVGAINLYYPAAVSLTVFAVGICLFHNHRHFLSQR